MLWPVLEKARRPDEKSLVGEAAAFHFEQQRPEMILNAEGRKGSGTGSGGTSALGHLGDLWC